jgi:hypothetical protein
MAILFQDGFENGFNAWLAGLHDLQGGEWTNPVITTAHVHSGSYALLAPSNEESTAIASHPIAAASEWDVEAWFYIDAMPSSEVADTTDPRYPNVLGNIISLIQVMEYSGIWYNRLNCGIYRNPSTGILCWFINNPPWYSPDADEATRMQPPALGTSPTPVAGQEFKLTLKLQKQGTVVVCSLLVNDVLAINGYQYDTTTTNWFDTIYVGGWDRGCHRAGNWISDGSNVYADDVMVSSAAAATGTYVFDHWMINGVTYTQNPVTITAADGETLSVQAIYVPYTPPPVTYTLTISSTAGGTTVPSPGAYSYADGTQVMVTAVQNTGYTLDHWVVDGVNVGYSSSVTVTMSANHTVQAVFVTVPPATVVITLAAGSNGTTNPVPGNYTMNVGYDYQFQALPNSGYYLDHWEMPSGISLGAANPIIIHADLSMSGETLMAYFSLTPPPTRTISGTVKNQAGTPLAGVTVATGSQSTSTDSNGNFALTLPAGIYQVVFALAGYQTFSTNVDCSLGDVTGMAVTMSPSITPSVSPTVIIGGILAGVTVIGLVAYGLSRK